MDPVLRVIMTYAFLLVAFRIAGKRALSEATTFDLLLLLVISETTQEALVGEDNSITHAFLLITSFLAVEVVLSVLKQRFPRVDRLLEGKPVTLMANGTLDTKAMQDSHVDEGDILEAAREIHGIERLAQIRGAVLERTGKISIIPER